VRQRVFHSGLVLFFFFGLVACTDTPVLSPLRTDATLLAFGDSLTWGTGGGENGSYPFQLEQLIGRRVINAGVPGEISAEGVKRLTPLLLEHQPQLLILCHGGNDLLRRLDRLTLRNNLKLMIEAAQQAGVEVLLIGVPNPGILSSPPGLYAELATEYKLPYLGEILTELETERKFKSDAVHLNAAGYLQLAKSVQDSLETAQAL